MFVCVCLSTKICFNPRVTLIPTLQCDAVQMHLVCCLSVCSPDWLSLSISVSFSVAHYSSIRRDCEFTAQVARDNKRQQMEKKGKQAQMSTSNRERDRKKERQRCTGSCNFYCSTTQFPCSLRRLNKAKVK